MVRIGAGLVFRLSFIAVPLGPTGHCSLFLVAVGTIPQFLWFFLALFVWFSFT